jgi:TolB protein
MNIARLLLVVIAPVVFPLAYAQQQIVMFSMDRTPVHSQLFIANGDGTGERVLLPSSGMDYSPSFSSDGQWVVFTSERDGSADIYRVHPDGTGMERLTDDPAFDDQAVLSPDGKSLAFVSTRGSGRARLWVMDIASRRARLLTEGEGGDFRPAWSPDGRLIAFSSDRGTHAGHLPGGFEKLQSLAMYVINPDGSGLRQVTRGRGVAGSPRWSADGKRIFYYETTELAGMLAENGNEAQGRTQIVSVDVATGVFRQHTSGDGVRVTPQPLPGDAVGYLVNVNGSRVVRVQHADGTYADSKPGLIQGPSWTADGKFVVYSKFDSSRNDEMLQAYSRDPQFRLLELPNLFFPAISPKGDEIAVSINFRTIALMKQDGSSRRILFNKKDGMAVAPAWSPDGSRIAFSEGVYFAGATHPTAQVDVMNSDGTALRKVTPEGSNSGFPSWSPDGLKLVYEQDGHLVIQTLSTGECVNLTNPEGQRDNFPRWSPKGDWISFTSNREADQEYRIYLIRPDGSGLHKLTDSPGDAHASWSPDATELIFSSARMASKMNEQLGWIISRMARFSLFVQMGAGFGSLQTTSLKRERLPGSGRTSRSSLLGAIEPTPCHLLPRTANSRVGFAHHYRPLQGDELSFVLTRHWRKLGLALDEADFTDTQAIASIARITGGNFRLLHRLFVQIERILKINGLTLITDDVVEAARSTLVIGAA